MTRILHITRRSEWEAARGEGVYHPASLESDGFIHLSQPPQVLHVANTFYMGQRGLVLLEVETDLLKADLRWEPPDSVPLMPGKNQSSPHGFFPHLYGPLNLEAVVAIHDFPPGADGLFDLPPELATAG